MTVTVISLALVHRLADLERLLLAALSGDDSARAQAARLAETLRDGLPESNPRPPMTHHLATLYAYVAQACEIGRNDLLGDARRIVAILGESVARAIPPVAESTTA